MSMAKVHPGLIALTNQQNSNKRFDAGFTFPFPCKGKLAEYLHHGIYAIAGMLSFIAIPERDFERATRMHIHPGFYACSSRVRSKPVKDYRRVGPGFPYCFYGCMNNSINGDGIVAGVTHFFVAYSIIKIIKFS